MKLDAKQLHIELFSEEYDKMSDSILDAKERAKGINPMSKDYQLKVAKKREHLGVSRLSSSGNSIDDSSWELCVREFEARKNNNFTSKTKIISDVLINIRREKEELNKQIDLKMYPLKGIDPENPSTWTEIMINNCYNKMVAADRWEMETSMDYEDFVKQINRDKHFARSNCPRYGMDKEDYNS